MVIKFFHKRDVSMSFVKIVGFGRHINMKYFITPILILFPCLVIAGGLLETEPKLVDSGAKFGVTCLDDVEHYCGCNVIDRVKINKNSQNLRDEFRFSLSDNSIIANFENPHTTNKSAEYSDNGRNEINQGQRGFWYGWQWVLLYVGGFCLAFTCALWSSFYVAEWYGKYGIVFSLIFIKKWFISKLYCSRASGKNKKKKFDEWRSWITHGF